MMAIIRKKVRLLMACICVARLNGFIVATRQSKGFPLSAVAAAATVRDRVSARRMMSDSQIDNKTLRDDPSSQSVGQADIGGSPPNLSSEYQVAEQGLSWRSLIEISSNRSRKTRGSNYVQLATVDPQSNEPRCRTVVFRGFLQLPKDHDCAVHSGELSCVAKMITDLRSHKVTQVTKHENAVAEMVWWFPKTSEQYRILGKILFVGNGQFPMDNNHVLRTARKEMWGNISDAARESFLTTTIPGDDFEEEPTTIATGGRDDEGKIGPAPDNFLLMLLLPREVDYLRLTNMYRQVDQLADGQWSFRRVVP